MPMERVGIEAACVVWPGWVRREGSRWMRANPGTHQRNAQLFALLGPVPLSWPGGQKRMAGHQEGSSSLTKDKGQRGSCLLNLCR